MGNEERSAAAAPQGAPGGRRFGWKEYLVYFLGYTAVFLVMAAAVFVWFWMKKRRFVWQTDGVNQHYYGLLYFARWGREVLSHFRETGVLQLPTFTFRMGYGEDLFTTLAYYVIGDPFSLPAIFVPEKHLLLFHDLMLLVRFYLAGITFSAYCFYMHGGKKRGAAPGTGQGPALREAGALPDGTGPAAGPEGAVGALSGGASRLGVLAGAVIYVFNGFTLSGMRHHYFLNPFVFFPLLLIGCERIFRKKKPGLFIFMVFVSAVSNFYFFYMMVLMTVLYAVWRSVRLHGLRRFGRVLLDAVSFAWYGLLGTLLAAFIFLPVVLRFLQDPRTSDDRSIPLLWPLRYYRYFLDCFVTGSTSALSDSWTYMGFGAVAALCVCFLFIQRKRHFDLKAAFLGLTALLLTPAAGCVLNGFSYPANRWMFAYALLVGFISAAVLPEMVEDAGTGQLMAALILLAAYVAVCVGWEYTFARASAQAVMLALFGLAAVLLGRLRLLEKAGHLPGAGAETGAPGSGTAGTDGSSEKGVAREEAGTAEVGKGTEPVSGRDGKAVSAEQERSGHRFLKRKMSVRVQAVLLACVMLTAAGEAYYAFAPSRNAKVFEYLSRAQIETQTAKDSAAAAELIDGQLLQTEDAGDPGKPFYRYTAYNPENNTSLLYGVSNTQYYWSLSNASTNRFFNETGQLNRMIHLYDTLDDRTFLNEIAGIRYFLGNDAEGLPWGYDKVEGLSYSNGDLWPDTAGLDRYACEVYENRYALPFGFATDRWISREDYEALDIPQRQEALLQGILLEEDPGEGFRQVRRAEAQEAAGRSGAPGESEGTGTDPAQAADAVNGAEAAAAAAAVQDVDGVLAFTDRRVPVQISFDGTKVTAEGLAEAGAGAQGASGAAAQSAGNAANAENAPLSEAAKAAEAADASYEAGTEAAAADLAMEEGQPAAFHVLEDGSGVTLRFAGMENCETMLYVRGLAYAPPAGEAGPTKFLLPVTGYAGETAAASKQIGFTTPDDPWTTGRRDFLVNFRYHGEPLDRIVLTFPTAGTYTFDSVEVVCQPMTDYPAQAQALGRDVLTDLDIHEMGDSFATEAVTGHIDLDAPRILCLQMPRTPGWTAYVDGLPAELLQADTMFSALLVPAGSHDIELRYQTPGLRLGVVISAGTLSVLLLFGIIYAAVSAILARRERRLLAVPAGTYEEVEVPSVTARAEGPQDTAEDTAASGAAAEKDL